MNILAIDTVSENLSLAVKFRSQSHYILEKVGSLQSEFIIPKIQELIALPDLSITIKDINVIAYNQGPGSFTGARIGLSIAIGIAIGLNIKLIPLSSFVILAQNVIAKQRHYLNDVMAKQIIVGIDARLNQIYLAGINSHDMSYCLQPQLVDPCNISTILSANSISIYESVFVGSGFNQYVTQLAENIPHELILNLDYPNALNMLKLIESGYYSAISVAEADILYLRNKIALNSIEQKLIRSNTV